MVKYKLKPDELDLKEEAPDNKKITEMASADKIKAIEIVSELWNYQVP